MAYRALDVKVAKIDLYANRMVIRQDKVKTGKIEPIRTVFNIDINTIITNKYNRSLKLADIKVGKRVSVDFIKTKDKKLLVKGISVLN